MTSSRYKGRRLEICFVSEEELERWENRAEKAKVPLSKWVREVVENYLADEELKPRRVIENDSAKLREQNRTLKRELEKTEAALQLSESQLIRLKHGAFLNDSEKVVFASGLVNLLRSGCTYSGLEILKGLHIIPADTDAIKIINRQLEFLAKSGFVTETPKGWRWIK